MVYGADELSTINQRRLIMARRIVTKLVVAGAMSDAPAIGPRTLTIPFDKGDSTLIQIFPGRVRARRCTLGLIAGGADHGRGSPLFAATGTLVMPLGSCPAGAPAQPAGRGARGRMSIP